MTVSDVIGALKEVVFSKEACRDSFSSVSADINEPADDGVRNDNKNDIFPPVEVDNSLVDVNGAQDIEKSG